MAQFAKKVKPLLEEAKQEIPCDDCLGDIMTLTVMAVVYDYQIKFEFSPAGNMVANHMQQETLRQKAAQRNPSNSLEALLEALAGDGEVAKFGSLEELFDQLEEEELAKEEGANENVNPTKH